MKVQRAIEYLSKLDPNEDIVIAWWDREWLECSYIMQGHEPLTAKEMESIADVVEGYDHIYESVCDAIEEEARDVLLDRGTVTDRREVSNV